MFKVLVIIDGVRQKFIAMHYVVLSYVKLISWAKIAQETGEI